MRSGDRTQAPLLTRQALCRLSHIPKLNSLVSDRNSGSLSVGTKWHPVDLRVDSFSFPPNLVSSIAVDFCAGCTWWHDHTAAAFPTHLCSNIIAQRFEAETQGFPKQERCPACSSSICEPFNIQKWALLSFQDFYYHKDIVAVINLSYIRVMLCRWLFDKITMGLYFSCLFAFVY